MVTPARCRRLLALLLATLLGLGRIATAEAAADAEEATLEVVLEPLGEAPFEQEMVLLTIHGSYRGTITRERLEQPSSPDFGWMQLGTNQWSDESARGRQARRFERRIAIFPQRSGRLEVPSFVHHLTLLDDQGRRREIAVRSAPVSFAVRPRPAGVDWWLPARAVRLTEAWDRPPDQLGLGELARRSVTLEVEGVGPQQLPPPPAMRAVGLVAFADPEERSTRLTPDGPVSSVTWHWTVKPITDANAMLEAVTIPWFDTVARAWREVVIPAQPVGLAAAALTAGSRSLADRLALPIGLLAGFGLGLLLLLPGLRLRTRAELARLPARLGLLPDAEARALRRAARRGDLPAVRTAAYRLLGDTPRRSLPHRLARELAHLDRLLFGRQEKTVPLDLRGLVRGLLKVRRTAG